MESDQSVLFVLSEHKGAKVQSLVRAQLADQRGKKRESQSKTYKASSQQNLRLAQSSPDCTPSRHRHPSARNFPLLSFHRGQVPLLFVFLLIKQRQSLC